MEKVIGNVSSHQAYCNHLLLVLLKTEKVLVLSQQHMLQGEGPSGRAFASDFIEFLVVNAAGNPVQIIL